MEKKKQNWGREFDKNWGHWVCLSEVKDGVNFNHFRDGVKSWFIYFINQLLEKQKEEILERIKNDN